MLFSSPMKRGLDTLCPVSIRKFIPLTVKMELDTENTFRTYITVAILYV